MPLFSFSPGMKKNSPYTKFFKQAIHDILENGQIDIYKKRHTNDISTCKTNRKAKSLGFTKLASLFLILICGLILSILIYIFEYCNQPMKSMFKVRLPRRRLSSP